MRGRSRGERIERTILCKKPSRAPSVKLTCGRPVPTFGPWLFTIMHNQNVNVVRRAIRDEAGVNIDQISFSLVATTDPTASRQLYELDRALARLPNEQREVILLVGLEGMSYEEAAAILSVPIGTVRSRLSRGRDMLRSLFRHAKQGPP